MAKHWVPQHILQGFSTDGIHICQHDKKGEVGSKMVPIKVACNARERRYPNGQVDFHDLELRRTTAAETTQNWWQSFRIEGTDTGIKAHGAVPRYRVAD